MASETSLDAAGLRRLLSEIQTLGDDLGAVLARLKNVRTTVPGPWGTDEFGKKFEQSNEPKAETMVANGDITVKNIRLLIEAWLQDIEDIERVDRENAEYYKR